jgi:pyridinium-3,5-biscarboxylic acid mononucleotide sulfurtransferase
MIGEPPGGLEQVRALLRKHSPVLIAYSGGVDSATLLAMAAGDPSIRAQAVIADSPSLPRKSLAAALEEAERIGMPVRVLSTREMEDPEYASNPVNRCYFCKAELFRQMENLAKQEGFLGLAYGENADDVAADRPGSQAAKEFSVIAPLREAGLGKADVRAWARHFGLRVADAPAQPCLSSRVRHGVFVTPEILALVECGEEILEQCGFRIRRVRYLGGAPGCNDEADGPRTLVQVGPDELELLEKHREEIATKLRDIGFVSVEFDPVGYRGPSLQIESLQ